MKALFDRVIPWLAEPDRDREPGGGPSKRVRVAAQIAAHTAVLIVVFKILRRLTISSCHASAIPHGWSILETCLEWRRWQLAAGVVIVGLLLTLAPRLRQGWPQFEGGKALRWFVGALVVVLAWSGSAYAYNSWYDQPHLIDRVAVIVLAALVFWRPFFVLIFVFAYWAVLWQLEAPPLGFFILAAEFMPLVNVLTMFGAAFLVQAIAGRRIMTGFVYLTLCIVAANFWEPGFGKVQLGWLAHGHVYLVLPNAYTHGWLGFLDPQTISSMTVLLAHADWPMRIGTLCIECGSLFMLASRRTAKTLLVLCSMLLGAFFLTIGYLFWKWLALHAVLWVLLFQTRDSTSSPWGRKLFTRERFAVSVLVIGGAGWWLAPARLAWFDTPVTNTLRYEAVGLSGAVYELPPDFFAPYESHIAMASFVGRLVPAPMLAMTYGVTGDITMARNLARARTPADIVALEQNILEHDPLGRTSAFDGEFVKVFDDFLRRAALVANRHLAAHVTNGGSAAWVKPLPFIWTFPHAPAHHLDEPIAAMRVYWISSFFDGQRYVVFRQEPVLRVEIPQ